MLYCIVNKNHPKPHTKASIKKINKK